MENFHLGFKIPSRMVLSCPSSICDLTFLLGNIVLWLLIGAVEIKFFCERKFKIIIVCCGNLIFSYKSGV